MTDRQLIDYAKEASVNAYAPYSRFSVGAERGAVCKAISAGHRNFRRIAVYADSRDYCVPCGTCRQVLSEFAPDIEILCVRSDGRYVSYRLSELLPLTFNSDFLN